MNADTKDSDQNGLYKTERREALSQLQRLESKVTKEKFKELERKTHETFDELEAFDAWLLTPP